MGNYTEDYIGRKEHEEFAKRMEDEHHRISRRISVVEEVAKENSKILNSVNTLAVNMEMMFNEQKEQGKRLEKLEARDGEKWRSLAKNVAIAVISAVIGYIAKQLGM